MTRTTSARPRIAIFAVVITVSLAFAGCRGGSTRSGGGGGGGGGGGNTKAGAPGPPVGFDGTTITLGVISPQTGIAQIIGKPLTNGNVVYFKALNDRGGIAGKYKVNLEVRDR